MSPSKISMLLLVASVMAPAPLLRAESPPGMSSDAGEHGTQMRHPHFTGGMPPEISELDLTPAQKQSIQQLAERYRTRAIDLRQRAADIREQMLDVSPDDPAYAEVTTRSAESAAVLAADLVKLASELRAEIHALLTAEQRQLLKDRAREKRQSWDEWRNRHSPPAK